MRDKLIGLIASKVCSRYLKDTCLSKWSGSCGECECGRNFQIGDVADYLLANGVIAPPCKIRDTIWYIDKNYNIQNAEVTCIDLRGTSKHIIATRYVWETEETIKLALMFERLNVDYWLTKTEAERALAEMRSEQ
jgi:hypothetical protein